MKKNSFFILITLFIFCFHGMFFSLVHASSQVETGKDVSEPASLKLRIDPDQYISQLKEEIPKLMEKGLIPGLSLAVVREGTLFWTQGFGVKNMETAEPVTDTTIFEAASLSKPVFAYGVLKLVEKGQLDLDKPLYQYVTPSYIRETFSESIDKDNRFKLITARRVLSHTCGFPNWRQGNLEILFTPGEKYSYSGEGFVFLQRVVEQITGKNLEDFMQETVLKPLGMTQSSYTWIAQYDKQAANPHRFLKPHDLRKGAGMNAASSLKTTARDFSKFIVAIMNETGLKKETLGEMLKPQSKPEKGQSLSWGLGVGLQHSPTNSNKENGIAYWQWGDNDEFKAFFIGFKNEKLGVVYFANNYFGLSIAEDLVRLALGGEHPALSSGFLSYERCDSPKFRLIVTYVKKGIDETIKMIRGMLKQTSLKTLVTEEALRNFGSGLLDNRDVEGAVKIFEFNIELHPLSFAAHKNLARAYLEKGDRPMALSYYQKALQLNKDKKFDKSAIEWDMEWMKVADNPVKLQIDYLKTLEGDYRERHIRLQGDQLYYFRNSKATKDWKKLIPMSKDTFIFEDSISFRIRFVCDETGEVKKIIGLYEEGRQDESPRNK